VKLPDYSKVQNRLLSYKVDRRRELDPVEDADRIKRREERIEVPTADQKFKRETRWLPNSAFQTYYGKPAFESYGIGNTNPTWGGLGYGQYMVSHNVNPHRYPNNPEVKQVTESAEVSQIKQELIREKYNRSDNHVPRKTRDEYAKSQNQLEQDKEALSLAAVTRPAAEERTDIQPHRKPDLLRTDVFASKDDTPRNSETASSKSKGKKRYPRLTQHQYQRTAQETQQRNKHPQKQKRAARRRPQTPSQESPHRTRSLHHLDLRPPADQAARVRPEEKARSPRRNQTRSPAPHSPLAQESPGHPGEQASARGRPAPAPAPGCPGRLSAGSLG